MTMPPGSLLLFWDYDTQWGADRSRMPGGPKDWGHLEFENTERLLELHAEYEVPACFAVVGRAAEPGNRPYHDPGQIRRIHAMGHEIGSHSHQHDWLPALVGDRLRATLSDSRSALEQCIGERVVTFVPPFNQPFDYPRRLSFSLSERREAGPARTGLSDLCRALGEAGYEACRVAYRPMGQRMLEKLARRRLDKPRALERVGPIRCFRLNTPGGFARRSLSVVERCAREGGVTVVYGHPHSLHSGGAQDEEHLVPFLQKVREWSRAGRLRAMRPRDLIAMDHA
jgi:hypothetical protein